MIVFGVFLLIGAVVMYAIQYLSDSYTNELRQMKVTNTVGMIEDLYHEDGDTIYWISLNVNGQKRREKSIPYFKTNRKYHIGDQVNVCYNINERGRMTIYIDDDSLICGRNLETGKGLLYASIASIIASIVIMIIGLFEYV